MSRATLALTLAAATLPATRAAPAAAKVRTGPAGDAFYTPPSPLPSGTHGAAIWARGVTNTAKLTSARSNRVVLYTSTGVTGKPVAVSGVVSVPKGKAPTGGGAGEAGRGLRGRLGAEGQGAEGRLAGRHVGPRHDGDRGRVRAVARHGEQ